MICLIFVGGFTVGFLFACACCGSCVRFARENERNYQAWLRKRERGEL